DKHDASVQKFGWYDAGNNKMYYKAVVHSKEGTNSNIKVKDLCLGSALGTPAIKGVYVSDEYGNKTGGDVSYNNTALDKGFELTINDPVPQGQSVTVEYEVPLDYSKISKSGNAQFSETGNEVTITVPGDEDETNNTSIHEEPGITFSSISKNNTAVSDIIEEGGKKYRLVTWKVTANSERKVSLKGSDIKDTLYTGSDTTSYYGDGIQVVKIAPDGSRGEAETVNWSRLGVNDQSKGWSYTATDDGNYAYEITYQTKVDMTGWNANEIREVVNIASDKYDEETGRITITNTVEPKKPKISKSAVDYSQQTSTWKITVEIPAGWSGDLSLEENAPKTSDGAYQDTFESLEIDGLDARSITYSKYVTDGVWGWVESDIAEATKANIDFGKVEAADTNRTVTISVVTKNNQDWIEAAEQPGYGWFKQQGHENKVSETYTGEDGNPVTEETSDKSNPLKEVIDKNYSQVIDYKYVVWDKQGQQRSVKLPLYRFTVTVQGTLEREVDIADSFDTDLFKVLEVTNIGEAGDNLNVAYGNDQWGSKPYGNSTGGATVTVEETKDGATFHLKELVRDKNNLPYPMYTLVYYLAPNCDLSNFDEVEAAVKKLDEYVIEHGTLIGDGGNADGRKYAFTNTAIWNGHTDDAEFERSVTRILNKTGSDNNDGTYSYTITLNPDKRKINGGINYELSDVFSGAQVLKDSISVRINGEESYQGTGWKIYDSEAAAAADDFDGVIVIYDGQSNTIMTVEIPDEKNVVISYKAKSKGEVTINPDTKKAVEKVSNTATALDYHYTVDFTHEYDIISKKKSVNDDGTRTFAIEFNKDHLKLNGGNKIDLTDEYSGGLEIDNDSFEVKIDPEKDAEGKDLAAAVLSSKKIDGTKYTFTVPDATHVIITYKGSLKYTTDDEGNSKAEYKNTVTGVNVNDVVEESVEAKTITKKSGEMVTEANKTEETEAYLGAIPFTIEFNPLSQTLNNGNLIELTDTFENLKILYNTIKITPSVYPAGSENAGELIAYDVTGNQAVFHIPDSTRIVIEYYAQPDFAGKEKITWKNTVEAQGFTAERSNEETKDSSASGTGSVGNAVWLFKYESGHMERALEGAKFALSYFDEANQSQPVTDTTGKQIVFETQKDPTMGTGYVYVTLTHDQGYEMGLEEDTIYTLTEIEAPKGYKNEGTAYSFVLLSGQKPVEQLSGYNAGVHQVDKEEIVKVTNEKITQDIKVVKNWTKLDRKVALAEESIPESVTVQLYYTLTPEQQDSWKAVPENTASEDDPFYGIPGTAVLTADQEWTHTWAKLPAGYYYKVEEINAPEGFTVYYENNDGIQNGEIKVTNDRDHDDKGYELPLTGGSGTFRYMGSGFAMLLMAAFILYIKQRLLFTPADHSSQSRERRPR
ncbi:MAG: hypothetical protein Q4B09_06270, partial [Lachnospiraceae bacterium]|nr:hypothetical protein [Lachnospiraceae bacterium]